VNAYKKQMLTTTSTYVNDKPTISTIKDLPAATADGNQREINDAFLDDVTKEAYSRVSRARVDDDLRAMSIPLVTSQSFVDTMGLVM
jgi:hypothetical protein